MRYIIAAFLVGAFAVPAASALPAFGPYVRSAQQTSPIVQVTKHNKQISHRHSRGSGGIHALVGSGDY